MNGQQSPAAPSVGRVSDDGVAIMGLDGYAFLYGGSNGYYEQYLQDDVEESAVAWAERTAARHRKCAGISVLSLFVPNKATCLPGLYPLWLPEGGTPLWLRVKTLLAEDSGSLFCDSLFLSARDDWPAWDSHWTAAGCLKVLNEVCSSLGVETIADLPESMGEDRVFGDLSDRWGSGPVGGPATARFLWEGPEPQLVSDLGEGTRKGHVTGRVTVWRSDEATLPVRVCIVGNSFSGAGFDQSHLTWWAARHFKDVVFVHSGNVPVDLLDEFQADVVIHQTVERFMPAIPSDDEPLASLQERYVSALRAETLA